MKKEGEREEEARTPEKGEMTYLERTIEDLESGEEEGFEIYTDFLGLIYKDDRTIAHFEELGTIEPAREDTVRIEVNQVRIGEDLGEYIKGEFFRTVRNSKLDSYKFKEEVKVIVKVFRDDFGFDTKLIVRPPEYEEGEEVKIFYNRDKNSSFYGEDPELYEFNREDLVKVPITYEFPGGDPIEFLEETFTKFNDYRKNPLARSRKKKEGEEHLGQIWVKQNEVHTSMSKGDGIQIGDDLFIAAEIGFSKED